MKKKYAVVAVLLVVLTLAGVVAANINTNKQTGSEAAEKREEADPETAEGKELHIVTSFYPVYIAVMNIIGDEPGITVENLTDQTLGCLHDYQLTPQDMIAISEADIFIVNGGGMESYITDVAAEYPDLEIINASEGIILLTDDGHEETEHDHEGHAHDHDHTHEINAHAWMNITKYEQQLDNITAGLISLDEVRADKFSGNRDRYKERLAGLKEEAEEIMKTAESRNIIIFHDSFEYFAEDYGLDIKYMIEMDEDTSLSAAEVAELIDTVNAEGVDVLFAEEQYSTKIADAIAQETDASVYVLDSLVTGDYSLDSYITGMKYNLEILKEALCN